MSHGVKLTLFVLAFNVIGFAEGYLLRALGVRVGAVHSHCYGGGCGAAESTVVTVSADCDL